MPNHINDWTIVLQLGAEGGSITLYGLETERGWVFSRSVSDWSPELIGEERIQHKSPVVDSWQAAIALLDDYPLAETFSFDGSPGIFGSEFGLRYEIDLRMIERPVCTLIAGATSVGSEVIRFECRSELPCSLPTEATAPWGTGLTAHDGIVFYPFLAPGVWRAV